MSLHERRQGRAIVELEEERTITPENLLAPFAAVFPMFRHIAQELDDLSHVIVILGELWLRLRSE